MIAHMSVGTHMSVHTSFGTPTSGHASFGAHISANTSAHMYVFCSRSLYEIWMTRSCVSLIKTVTNSFPEAGFSKLVP